MSNLIHNLQKDEPYLSIILAYLSTFKFLQISSYRFWLYACPSVHAFAAAGLKLADGPTTTASSSSSSWSPPLSSALSALALLA